MKIGRAISVTSTQVTQILFSGMSGHGGRLGECLDHALEPGSTPCGAESREDYRKGIRENQPGAFGEDPTRSRVHRNGATPVGVAPPALVLFDVWEDAENITNRTVKAPPKAGQNAAPGGISRPQLALRGTSLEH